MEDQEQTKAAGLTAMQQCGVSLLSEAAIRVLFRVKTITFAITMWKRRRPLSVRIFQEENYQGYVSEYLPNCYYTKTR